MIFKDLPHWIQCSAFLLALNAGMINVLSLMALLHQSISHMTGNVSLLAMAIWVQDWDKVLFLCLVILFFVLGSFYSGYILGGGEVRLGKRYGFPLTLVSLFIFLCWVFLPYFPRYALLWASAGMGMQNAMISHYKGAIIRTTHLSGVLTDLGLAIGYILRGLDVDKRRIILHLLLLIGFAIGGMIATILFHFYKNHAFLAPTGLMAILSTIYWIYYFKNKV